MTINLDDYPHIPSFKTYLNSTISFNNGGFLIGEWLMTGLTDTRYDSYRIYNCYGHPVSNVRFTSLKDTVEFGEFLNEQYKDYFILWYENEKADVPGLTRYTIPNGLQLYDVLQKYDNQIVSFEDVKNELYKFSN